MESCVRFGDRCRHTGCKSRTFANYRERSQNCIYLLISDRIRFHQPEHLQAYPDQQELRSVLTLAITNCR